uniref:Uncharacterized protein n=1 Tax=Arundo donax TaxID=35708 RepID=A0A0A8YPL9_ARUDO
MFVSYSFFIKFLSQFPVLLLNLKLTRDHSFIPRLNLSSIQPHVEHLK